MRTRIRTNVVQICRILLTAAYERRHDLLLDAEAARDLVEASIENMDFAADLTPERIREGFPVAYDLALELAYGMRAYAENGKLMARGGHCGEPDCCGPYPLWSVPDPRDVSTLRALAGAAEIERTSVPLRRPDGSEGEVSVVVGRRNMELWGIRQAPDTASAVPYLTVERRVGEAINLRLNLYVCSDTLSFDRRHVLWVRVAHAETRAPHLVAVAWMDGMAVRPLGGVDPSPEALEALAAACLIHAWFRSPSSDPLVETGRLHVESARSSAPDPATAARDGMARRPLRLG